MGKVTNLFIKSERKGEMISSDMLELHENYGIAQDINANKISPRQVLLVDLRSLKSFGLEAGKFRENITVDDFDLNSVTSGQVIRIGENVVLRVNFTCEVCGYITTLGVNKYPEPVLGQRGMLATVLKGGVIRTGDTVQLDTNLRFKEIPFRFRDRLLWVVNQIPSGKIVNYFTLLEAVGGSKSYLRAFPNILSRAENLPIHRVVNSKGELLTFIPDQKSLLEKEGIEFQDDQIIDIEKKHWDAEGLYLLKS